MRSPKKILFTANDPGGAHAILPVVQMLLARGDICDGLLTGPAREIFLRAGVAFEDAENIEDSSAESFVEAYAPDLLLCGGSVGATLDKRLLVFCHTRDVPSVYVLDFWNYYGYRFVENQAHNAQLPTRVCVIDERMKGDMYTTGIPLERIVVTGNPHFDHFTENISRDHENPLWTVFISQPIRKDIQITTSHKGEFDEYHILADVIKTLPPNMRLSIRLHPREEKEKFDEYLTDRITIGNQATLEEELSRAGLVIGMFSPVLMQSAFAGKPTISYQPGGREDDPLPTNALGVTQLARNEDELKALIEKYQQGTFPQTHKKIETLWPKGATERVVAVIDEII